MATPKQIEYVRTLRDQIAAANTDATYMATTALAYAAVRQGRVSEAMMAVALRTNRNAVDWRQFLVSNDEEATRVAIAARWVEIAAMTDEDITALDNIEISALISMLVAFRNHIS